jgi:hypothetical protein
MSLFQAYARSGPPKTRAQVLAEQESAALLPADLQAMLDAARVERIASEASLSAGTLVPVVEGTAAK